VVPAFAQADLSEQLECPGTARASRHASAYQRHLDVRSSAQLVHQQVLLEHEPDQIATRHTQIRIPPNRFSIVEHLATVGLVQASDDVEQRALPRARPTGHEHQLTRRHVKVDPRSASTGPKRRLTFLDSTAAPEPPTGGSGRPSISESVGTADARVVDDTVSR
jgi:hypothetical protein